MTVMFMRAPAIAGGAAGPARAALPLLGAFEVEPCVGGGSGHWQLPAT